MKTLLTLFVLFLVCITTNLYSKHNCSTSERPPSCLFYPDPIESQCRNGVNLLGKKYVEGSKGYNKCVEEGEKRFKKKTKECKEKSKEWTNHCLPSEEIAKRMTKNILSSHGFKIAILMGLAVLFGSFYANRRRKNKSDK